MKQNIQKIAIAGVFALSAVGCASSPRSTDPSQFQVININSKYDVTLRCVGRREPGRVQMLLYKNREDVVATKKTSMSRLERDFEKLVRRSSGLKGLLQGVEKPENMVFTVNC